MRSCEVFQNLFFNKVNSIQEINSMQSTTPGDIYTCTKNIRFFNARITINSKRG